MSEQLDQITLKAGTVIHYRGMPFVIPRDTVVEGRRANFDLVEASGNTPMTANMQASGTA
jgi:hypothetical protein